MSKNKMLNFTKALYLLALLATVISVIIVKSNIESGIAVKFVMGYVVLMTFILIYTPIMALISGRNLERSYIMKCISLFALNFVVIFILKCVSYYFLRNHTVDILSAFFHSMGLAFYFSCIEAIFKKDKINAN